MASKQISATKAARNFSEVLNQVRYRDTSFAIIRGREVIAELVPAGKAEMSLDDLTQLIRKLPTLSKDEAETWRKSIRHARTKQKIQVRSWD